MLTIAVCSDHAGNIMLKAVSKSRFQSSSFSFISLMAQENDILKRCCLFEKRIRFYGIAAVIHNDNRIQKKFSQRFYQCRQFLRRLVRRNNNCYRRFIHNVNTNPSLIDRFFAAVFLKNNSCTGKILSDIIAQVKKKSSRAKSFSCIAAA